MLFDSGALDCFVTPELAEKAELRDEPGELLDVVKVAGGKFLNILGRVRGVDVQVAGESMPADLSICSVELYDVILGMDWLSKFRA
ncbi:retropepsin-like aspartic protease, partial [Acinetobacter baumannii]